jgi:nanoRNase/pAp phosphatase (c-di-AMP/oligoRNAs hydrolase)
VAVNRIAGRFGGGGHDNAAGCTVRGDLAAVTAIMVAAV